MSGPPENWLERARTTLDWVRELGVVLQSARGPVPNVAQFVAGEAIRGSWWGHPAGKEIYEILTFLEDSPDVATTRLIGGKVTLLHARVWPSVARVADALGTEHLASVHSEHTPSGAHQRVEVPYPFWVPADVLLAASSLSEGEAYANLPECLR